MKIIKGDSILEVSEKVYEVIYKAHGYTVYQEMNEPQKNPKKQPKSKAGE